MSMPITVAVTRPTVCQAPLQPHLSPISLPSLPPLPLSFVHISSQMPRALSPPGHRPSTLFYLASAPILCLVSSDWPPSDQCSFKGAMGDVMDLMDLDVFLFSALRRLPCHLCSPPTPVGPLHGLETGRKARGESVSRFLARRLWDRSLAWATVSSPWISLPSTRLARCSRRLSLLSFFCRP